MSALAQEMRPVREAATQTVLSLELFNRKYWGLEPLEVARTGLEKMKAAVGKALSRSDTSEKH